MLGLLDQFCPNCTPYSTGNTVRIGNSFINCMSMNMGITSSTSYNKVKTKRLLIILVFIYFLHNPLFVFVVCLLSSPRIWTSGKTLIDGTT
jgi:hypothetical protein